MGNGKMHGEQFIDVEHNTQLNDHLDSAQYPHSETRNDLISNHFNYGKMLRVSKTLGRCGCSMENLETLNL
jgi:putative hemolysin